VAPWTTPPLTAVAVAGEAAVCAVPPLSVVVGAEALAGVLLAGVALAGGVLAEGVLAAGVL